MKGIRAISEIALLAALLAVCAWITIPAAVPFTLQTFGVFLALRLLGGKKGTIAVLVYIAMGAVGLPVFSGFGSTASLVGPTGGYIVGFAVCGLWYAALENRTNGRFARCAVMAGGLMLCYAFGTVWFVLQMDRAGKAMTFGAALMACVVPYIVPDLIKLAAADILSERIRRALEHGRKRTA